MSDEKRIGWYSDDELRGAGMSRDASGVIRNHDGFLVCGWSGRLHTKYLVPMPDLYPDGRVGVVYVDRAAAEEIAQRAGTTMQEKGLGGLAGMLVRIFLGWASHRIYPGGF